MVDKENPKASNTQHFETRENAIWGPNRLAKSNSHDVRLDGSLQIAGDYQESGGCLAGWVVHLMSFFVRINSWPQEKIQASLEAGRQHARLRKELGIKEKDTIEINLHGEIKFPSWPWRKPRK